MNRGARADSVLEMADTIIQQLDALLSAGISERRGLTEFQLLGMRTEIQKRTYAIRSGCLPPRDQRYNYLARELVDSWPFELVLVDLILKFECLYNAL